METPVDVLARRLGKIRDNGDIDFDASALACDIDLELQEKFLSIPFEEIEAVEIEEDRDNYHAGSGPEHCMATGGENPNWLYNHGINALALWWKLQKDAEKAEKEQLEAAKLARRPKPGVYDLWTGGEQHLAVVTSDRRILSMKPTAGPFDLTDIFDGMERKERWVFAPIETGLGA